MKFDERFKAILSNGFSSQLNICSDQFQDTSFFTCSVLVFLVNERNKRESKLKIFVCVGFCANPTPSED